MPDPQQLENTQPYREVTLSAVLLGLLQGAVLNVAFVYVALKLGFSLGGSALAAILGYVWLRVILRRGTTIENNLNQTIASAVNSSGTGVIFVAPAVFLLGLHENPEFSLWPMVMAGIAGSLLGVFLIAPLRKQLIERERLRFPTGMAVATVLRSGSAGLARARLLLIGGFIGIIWKLFMLSGIPELSGIIRAEELDWSGGVIPAYLMPYLYLSMMNFAAGLLSGRAGLPFFIGGIVAWWMISPASVYFAWPPAQLSATELADFIYADMLRPLGIGILIGAASMELLKNLVLLKNMFIILGRSFYQKSVHTFSTLPRQELPFYLLAGGALAAVAILFGAALTGSEVGLGQAFFIAALGTLWLGIAGLLITQATGLTDISPISGVTLVSMVIMLLLVHSDVGTAFLLTLTVSVAVGQSADMMQDLKTGFLVGSTPFVQQSLQLACAWLGVLISFGVMVLLWQSGTDGSGGFGPGTALPAPQAAALSGIVEAIEGHQVPLDKYILGGALGFLFAAAPVGGLGVLIGLAMYLPFSITLGYGLGCLTQMWVTRRRGTAYCEANVVPLAAGLIIGEALTSVGHAFYSISTGSGG